MVSHPSSRPTGRHLIWQQLQRLTRPVLVGVGALALTLLVSSPFWLPPIGRWVALSAQDVRHADAIVVLGGAVVRTNHGMRLYEQGVAPLIWHTGWVYGDSANPASEQLATRIGREHTIPDEALTLVTTYSTWEDGAAVAELVQEQGADQLVVVTSWHHSRRALCVVRHHLRGSEVEVTFSSARVPPHDPNDWWQHPAMRRLVLEELAKLAYYGLRYGLPVWEC